MGGNSDQLLLRRVQALARRQNGTFTREQLLGLGASRHAIQHRLDRGRLHRIHDGVYAFVPAEDLTRTGGWTAAVLACGRQAALSDESAGCLARFWEKETRGVEVTVPPNLKPRHRGILVHRRSLLPNEIVRRDGIQVTSPNATLVALAARFPSNQIEAAISRACFRRLTSPESLLRHLDTIGQRKGVARMRKLLELHLFSMTDSELEYRFKSIADAAGLPTPLTQHRVNGYRVDFWFPTLGLVVEADGFGSHFSAVQQTTDRKRDQAHTAEGLTQLRFTHYQVRHEPKHVQATLERVAGRLSLTLDPSPV